MALSKQRPNLYDRFRRRFVTATPEEMIRQKVLILMTEKLGYPKELLAVEKELSQLPHLHHRSDLPKRRADIICFGKNIHPEYALYPLLLIECKEGKIEKEAKEQASGYNHFVNASFVAIAGIEGILLIHPLELAFLPTYSDLIKQGRSC